MFEDNQSAICMPKNPQFHGREKNTLTSSTTSFESKLQVEL